MPSIHHSRCQHALIVLLSTLMMLVCDVLLAAEQVTLRLRWKPQFQFAGYYMALEKGFYRDAGLDVQIIAAEPGMAGSIDYVLQGQADFGIANSGIVRERAAGKPLVALAAIGQHAPAVWLVRADSGIHSLHDLVGRRLMAIPGGFSESIELFAPFLLEGIDMHSLTTLPTSYSVDSLINGEADAINAYVSNEPFQLQAKGVDYRVIRPRSYGVDFYSDILFTTEKYIAENPELVQRFLDASLKGWRYALNNIEPSVDTIKEKYAKDRRREHLLYEANTLLELINPEVISVGHMNPGRWQHIEQMHRRMGVINGEVDWDRFLYKPDVARNTIDYRPLLAALAFALLTGGLALWYRYLVQRLRYEALERQRVESKLRELATIDELTQVANRRYFFAKAYEEFDRANRYTRPLCLLLLDLDWFKQVNDRYGHQMGDQVLRHMGQVFKVVLRHSDIAGRIGGEEFAVLLPETELEVACQVAERLREAVANSTIALSQSAHCQITVSVGITAYGSGDDAFEQMYSRADTALYAAKRNGRDQVQVQT